MCRMLVTYKSRTGATMYYARIIAGKLGADRREWQDGMDLSGYDLVIYGGGVYAGTVNGLSEARNEIRNQHVDNFVIFATGGTPESISETIDLVWEKNLRGDDYSFPHFYMQSGLLYSARPFGTWLRMKICAKVMKSQMRDENGIPFKINKSYSIAGPEHADGLIEYVRNHWAS